MSFNTIVVKHRRSFRTGWLLSICSFSKWSNNCNLAIVAHSNISFGKPLFKKLQEYKIKGLPILSLNMILLAMSIPLINLKSTLKYLNGDKKNMPKKKKFWSQIWNQHEKIQYKQLKPQRAPFKKNSNGAAALCTKCTE